MLDVETILLYYGLQYSFGLRSKVFPIIVTQVSIDNLSNNT